MPQIEVTFDIDANGILNVSAKDKGTGKEQRIVIKASSGLTEDEIKRMVSDAEAHAEEDRKFRELVDSRNRADAQVHQADKTLKELGDKVDPALRGQIESALGDVKSAMAGDDKDVLDRKAEALATLLTSLAAAQAGPAGGAATGEAPQGGAAHGDDVVDADFEEVRNKDRKP